MSELGEPMQAHIDALHEKAEELNDMARHAEERSAKALRSEATQLVKKAARLRASTEALP